MRVRHALPLVAAANWDAWRLLATRAGDTPSAILATAMLGGFAWAWHCTEREARVPAWEVTALLGGCAVAGFTGPALLQVGAAVTAMTLLSARAVRGRALPLVGIALLAMPVLPTLDFLLAWPLRRISALIAAAMLRLNGIGVSVEGVALDWHGKLLLFDAPCSGVRMLWAALLLASAIALVQRFGFRRYASAMALAVAAAILGNALRAASLFYLENGFIPQLEGPVAHEAVGLAAFAITGAVLIAMLRPRPAAWRPA